MRPSGQGGTLSPILVVDGQDDLMRAASDVLRKEYAPTPVIGHSEAPAAAAQISQERPALLIASLRLPRVGGLDLIAFAQKCWGTIPIVVLDDKRWSPSGWLRVDKHMMCLEKPFAMTRLCECIDRLPGAPPRALPAAESETAPLDILDAELEFIEPGAQDTTRWDAPSHEQGEENAMALTATNIKETLGKLEQIEGFIGAALADSDSGMCLGYLGGGSIMSLEVAAASNTEVVRAKRKAMKSLNLRDEIEDILITLGKQYHLIRPVRTRANLFFYLALDRQRSNLAMARFALAEIERELAM